MSTLSLRIPDSLHKRVKELAAKENFSINQFITIALAEKLSALETEDYLNERAKRGDKVKFRKVLSKISDTEPEDFDKL